MRLHLHTILSLLLLFSFTFGTSQKPQAWTSADIQEKIEKLNFLGSVLYLAAHPDDENTRLIAYMANEVKAETAYLSLTRGDGGQNLIGTEIRELLGILRTQELLSARRIDGGKQFFSRANDFGYSKNPEETFEIWNKKEVFSDVIMTIRKFQPDIIINRFNHETSRKTHGHHTASAILAVEAFAKSGNRSIYPEHLSTYPAYKAKRIFFNTSWWFYGSREKFNAVDKSNQFTADIGVYYPLKGKSNSEIAALARSQHKCQGFGNIGTRGESIEYMELIDGSRPSKKDDIFSGINTSWTRVKGGANIGKLISIVSKTFDPSAPSKSIDILVEILAEIEKLEDSVWKKRKSKECKDIILACSGLYLDVFTSERTSTPGESLSYSIEAINRSSALWSLDKITSKTPGIDSIFSMNLSNNVSFIHKRSMAIPITDSYSSAYWLLKKGTLGMYMVEDKNLIGLPQTPDPVELTFHLKVNNYPIRITKPLVYKTSDPVKGEVYDPFEVLPPIFIESKEETSIFKPGQTKTIQVEVTAGKDHIKGKLIAVYGKNWKSEPSEVLFELDSKNEKKYFEFKITAPKEQDVNKLAFMAEIDGQHYIEKLIKIEYDHIPTQLVLQDNSINSICIDIKAVGHRIAYIMGAGDKVPEALRAIGYEVDVISEDDIRLEMLQKYPAVIVGIRAYNVMHSMKFHHKTLMQYVKDGGTVVTQYNTRHRLKSEEIGPYPIKLSRKRITDEYAEVKILAADHPVMNFPNKISLKDFDGWVQERGLYFPDEWDEHYTAILSSHDKGEEALTGGLLVADYGEGHFVYTGYSFFRELPAGVPGAYRLFANIISYGQQEKP